MQASAAEEFELDAERIVARRQGREGWSREARRQLEQRRWQDPDPIPRSRAERLLLAGERLEADVDAERAGNQAYEHYRATGRDSWGRRFSRPGNPYVPPVVPGGTVSVTDPDSKQVRTLMGFVQGYNAQVVVAEGQIALAAEITNSTVDFSQLGPMITATIAELEDAGVSGRPTTALADSQYWNEEHMDEVIADQHVQVLIPPDSGTRDTPRPGWTGGR